MAIAPTIMNDKRKQEDESFEELVSFGTVPPPGGGGADVHNARTAVAALPDSFLDELKSGASSAVNMKPQRLPRELVATRRDEAFELPTVPRGRSVLPDLDADGSAGAAVAPAAAPAPAVAPAPAAPTAPARRPAALSADDIASALGAALARESRTIAGNEAAAAFAPVAAPVPPSAAALPTPAPVLTGVAAFVPAEAPPFATAYAAAAPAAHVTADLVSEADLERAGFYRRILVGLAILAAVAVLCGVGFLVRQFL